MYKWVVLIVYLLIALAFVYNRTALIAWLQNNDPSDLPTMVALSIALGLVPVIPYGFVGAAMGMKFGTWLGGGLNILSSTVAALIMFALVRYWFKEAGRNYMAKMSAIDRLTALIERNAFIAVLIARIIPIIPAQAVNVYAGLCNIRTKTFFTASVLGKVPVMLVFAFLGDRIVDDWQSAIIVIIIYTGFLLLVNMLYRNVKSRN